MFGLLIFTFGIFITGCGSDQTSKAAVVATESPEQFKSQCTQLDYTQLARNPDKYKEQKISYVGKVVQVQESGNDVVMRVNVSKGEWDFWEDTIWVNYTKQPGSNRILENDVIQLWGTVQGLKKYTAVMGNEIAIPEINAKYVELYNGQATSGVKVNQVITQENSNTQSAQKTRLTEDVNLAKRLMDQYEREMINAINKNSFSSVEQYLLPGSNLYQSQKNLVRDLYKENIREELMSYEIKSISPIENQEGEFTLLVNESVKISYNAAKTSIKNFSWVYKAKKVNGKMYLTDISEP